VVVWGGLAWEMGVCERGDGACSHVCLVVACWEGGSWVLDDEAEEL